MYSPPLARSVRGFDLYAALSACQEHMIQFGGHKYAAGLTIRPEQYDGFCQRFEEVVTNRIQPEQQERTLSIDMEIPIAEITPKFYRIINQMAPFGPGNMRPVLLSKKVAKIAVMPSELVLMRRILSARLLQAPNRLMPSDLAWGML